MAQHDYDVANGSGAAVRADLNNLFTAIATNNSGTSEPGTTFAFMWWFDTSNALLKIRDATDASWVTVASLSGTTWVPYSEGIALMAGTAIGDIIRLEDLGDTAATPTLPAVDGSQLTGLSESFATALLHVRDEKTAGTAAGTFTSGDWRTRSLTTITNEISGATLGSNQITLPAGTYYIDARAPGFDCGAHKARLHNTSDATSTIIGSSETSVQGNETQTWSAVRGRFTIAAEKTFEIQHRCGTTKATAGLGNPANLGEVEVYTDVMIWKVG